MIKIQETFSGGALFCTRTLWQLLTHQVWLLLNQPNLKINKFTHSTSKQPLLKKT